MPFSVRSSSWAIFECTNEWVTDRMLSSMFLILPIMIAMHRFHLHRYSSQWSWDWIQSGSICSSCSLNLVFCDWPDLNVLISENYVHSFAEQSQEMKQNKAFWIVGMRSVLWNTHKEMQNKWQILRRDSVLNCDQWSNLHLYIRIVKTNNSKLERTV